MLEERPDAAAAYENVAASGRAGEAIMEFDDDEVPPRICLVKQPQSRFEAGRAYQQSIA